jgi:hypothetical protein
MLCALCANNTHMLVVLQSLSMRGEHDIDGVSGLDASCHVWGADCICACVLAEPPPCAAPVTLQEAVSVAIAVSVALPT